MGKSQHHPVPKPWCHPSAKGWMLPAAKIAAEISTSPHLLGSPPISRKKGLFLLSLFSLSPKASSLDVPSCGDSRGTPRCVRLCPGAFQGGRTFHKMDVSKGKDLMLVCEGWTPRSAAASARGRNPPLLPGAGLGEGIIGRCF